MFKNLSSGFLSLFSMFLRTPFLCQKSKFVVVIILCNLYQHVRKAMYRWFNIFKTFQELEKPVPGRSDLRLQKHLFFFFFSMQYELTQNARKYL